MAALWLGGVACGAGESFPWLRRVSHAAVPSPSTTTTLASARATYYDSAGWKPDGLRHFEVSPALADALGISYRDRSGRVVDAVTNTDPLRRRFKIEK